MADSFLVVLAPDAPIDLLAGELATGALAQIAGNRPAIHCRRFVQAPGELVELVPAASNRSPGQVASLLLQPAHVLLVLCLSDGLPPAGFVQG